MKKTIFAIIAAFCVLTFTKVHANDIAGASAALVATPRTCYIAPNENKMYTQKKAIISVLSRYNSPLVTEADTFLAACTQYTIPCYLLPAIAGVESGFGNVIYPNSNNAFGWGGGTIMFSSWKDSIMTVAKALKENYHADTASVYDIGHIYAPPSTTWASNVIMYMNTFETIEKSLTPMPTNSL